MIEPIMYLAIGFLLAILAGLLLLPLVHARAVRLTTRKLEAATPLSMAEIQADKDQLRAEFAMSARRLETSVEQLKAKTTGQLADLGKKTDAINRLKIELGEKNAAIFALETREKIIREQLQNTETEFADKTHALRTAETALAEKHAELSRMNGNLADRSAEVEGRQAELAVVRAQIELLTNRVRDAESEYETTQKRLEQQRNESESTVAQLADARTRNETLDQRVVELESQIGAHVMDAAALRERLRALELNLDTQTRLLSERDIENERLRRTHQEATRAAAMLRDEMAAQAGGRPGVLDQVRSEKLALEQALRNAHEERAKMQRQLEDAHQQADSSWTNERVETALLRERINDMAAEVAKVALALEGPDGTIETLLAADALGDTPIVDSPEAAPREPTGTLASRIRALRGHVSRAGNPASA